MASIFENDPRLAQTGAAPTANSAKKFVYPLTDMGNARMFTRMFRGRVRYEVERKYWLLWNGARWVRSDDGGIEQLTRFVKLFHKELYVLARSTSTLYTINFEAITSNEMKKWANKSQSQSKIKAMLELVKTFPGICVSQGDLDADPFLVGVQNGVLDLRTGQLMKNMPFYLITRHARAAYNTDATAPIFMQFINQVTLGRSDLADFLQEVFGYALSGLIDEQAFFIFLGAGANGKSTLVEIFYHLLADYARSMPGHAFIKTESRAIRNDLARLPGVRYAPCAEANDGKSLDEANMKRSTGGDTITARYIGREFFDFAIISKFFFTVNTLPHIAGADNGIYRRIIVVPFEAKFEEDQVDKKLKEKLKGELEGILAWAAQGFRSWMERGYLIKPQCVIDACKAYRSEMDTVQSFIEDECNLGCNTSTPLKNVYDRYKNWAMSCCVEPVKMHLFGTLMQQKGIRKVKSGSWKWQGVAFKTATPSNIFCESAQASTTGPELP